MQTAETAETAPPDAMKRFRRWIAIAVALATLGYFAYAMLRGTTGDDPDLVARTTEALITFDWALYVPILLLTLVNYGLRYFKWSYLLGRLGIDVPHRTNLWIFTAGLAMVISPAKAGELVKPYLVWVTAGAPVTKTLPALAVERITDGIAVVLLTAVGVSTFLPESRELIYGTIGVVIVGLVVLSLRPLARGLLGLLSKIPGLSGIAHRLEEAYEATRVCIAPVPLAITLVASLVAWFAECIGYWLVFIGLQQTVSLDAATFLYAFATVFGAPSPGGMGMADAALVEGAVGIANVGPAEAFAAALLIRVATLWFGVILGAIAMLRMERVIEDAALTMRKAG
ncbi:MAG: lysylphosphatidylglycerol synthase transmembrane domain-containing protein [Myxococcota bacterium]